MSFLRASTDKSASSQNKSAQSVKGKNPFTTNQKAENPFVGIAIQNPFIQAKLSIGQSNDAYEQEADQIADKVIQQSAPNVQTKCDACAEEESVQKKPLVSQISPLVQKTGIDEEELQAKPLQSSLNPLVQKTGIDEEELQAKPLQSSLNPLVQKTGIDEEELQMKSAAIQKKDEASHDLENKINGARGKGNTMDNTTQSLMSGSFGADFSQVNIHTDSNAVQMSQELGAKAFTVGNDVFFNQGEYNPQSNAGKHLLAHELTHTVQQGSVLQKKTSA
jgi:hypothetical protein